MKIVIDIPDSEYLAIKNSDHTSFADFSSKECMMYAIRNGIPYEEKELESNTTDETHKMYARLLSECVSKGYLTSVDILKVMLGI